METKSLTILNNTKITKKLDVLTKFIKDMKKQAGQLTIAGIEDKDCCINVHAGQITVIRYIAPVLMTKKDLKIPCQVSFKYQIFCPEIMFRNKKGVCGVCIHKTEYEVMIDECVINRNHAKSITKGSILKTKPVAY